MSWISGLAGKAESFLTNLDNSAAQALSHKQINERELTYIRKIEPTVVKNFDTLSDYQDDRLSVVESTSSLPLKLTNPRTSKSLKSNDEDLFQFLNKSDNMASVSMGEINNRNSRQMDNVSDKGSSGYRTITDEVEKYDKVDVSLRDDTENNLQAENKCLRSEISSLNQEISALFQRSHKTEEECKRLRNQLEKVSVQLRETDRKFREVVSEKDDLLESLKVKDSKISVLQTELLSLREKKFELNGEANLVSDHRNKIMILEQELLTKSELLEKLENEKLVMQAATDDSKIKLAQTVNSYEKQQADDKRKIEMLNAQLDVAKQKSQTIQQELKDYKMKATKILQMKEKVISSLRGNGENFDDQLSPNSQFEDFNQELAELRRECDSLREEVARCRVELEHKDFDLQELDQQMHTETESLRKNSDLLEEQLDREKQMREDVDADFRQLTKENRHLQEKYVREKAEFHDHIASKDDEIGRLRQMLSTKQANQCDQVVELEARIRSLTDIIIQKQSALDSNKADCQSLQIRLERAEFELSSLQKSGLTMSNNGVDRRLINTGSSDFLTINMKDAPVTKNLKTALNSMDKFSLRLGIFFRRYPPARLFLICYTILLHFWVLFVLLTYQPEMHQTINPKSPNVQK